MARPGTTPVGRDSRATREVAASEMMWRVASALSDCNGRTISERGVAATYPTLARVAIEAMGNPTPAMMTAAAAVAAAYDSRITGHDDLAAAMLGAMIEAALQPEVSK